MRDLVGLLLAAGSAKRFGSNKLLHPLPHGVPIAVQAARHLKPETSALIAIIRPGQDTLFKALREEGCDVVICENADEGMGASLACGARAAGLAKGYLVALADMPFIRRSSIAAVRGALQDGAALAAPYWRGRRGHPVGISHAFYEELAQSKGDEGAKSILAANEARLVKVPLGDPGVLRDIDRPEDLLPPIVV